jgi:hypothetical protein
VAAASGNTRAQQNYLNLLMGAEADRRVATMEFLKAAVDYKKHWHQVLAERARTGTTGPEPVPHPDDVLIDYETGNIRIDGPVMEDQKQARDQLRAIWPKLERELMGINEQIESDPNNLSLQLGQHIGQLVAARFLAHTWSRRRRTETGSSSCVPAGRGILRGLRALLSPPASG